MDHPDGQGTRRISPHQAAAPHQATALDSAEILNRAPGSVAPKLRAPDTPQAAFDLFTSTSRQTTSSSQVTSAKKFGLTPRILICRVEKGSDEHS